jgi:FkbM family methyltransferase
MLASQALSKVRSDLGITLPIDSLVHVGANVGQEAAAYEISGINGYHIEAMPKEFRQLEACCRGFPKQTAINACCDAELGISVEFNVTSNSQSSSLLDLGRHAIAYPKVELVEKIKLETTTLDQLVAEKKIPANPSLVVLDVQGAESRVLYGAKSLLNSFNLWGVLSEVSLDSMYKDGTTFDELYSKHLKPRGFFLKSADFNRKGWTDALFLKRWWRLEGEENAPLERYGLRSSKLSEDVLNTTGKCSQSSFSQWSKDKFEASNLIRCLPNGHFAFHTNDERNSWWQVEWPETICFNKVICFNRMVGGKDIQNRILGAIFEISMDGESWATIYKVEQSFGGQRDGKPLRLSLPSTQTRFFRIRQPNKRPLHLDCIRFRDDRENALD